MDLKHTVGLGIRQLNEKRVRTILTILMVVIGVASIVALTSQTAGASKSIQETLGALGPTSIIVMPSGKTVFTSADVASLEALPNVSSVTPIVTGSGTLSANGQNVSVEVLGLTTNGLDALLGSKASKDLYQGSVYTDGITPSAVIGHGVAFSSSTDPNLQVISANDIGTLVVSGSSGSLGSSRGSSSAGSKIAIPIVGVLQTHSSPLIQVDSSVIVSLPFAQTLFHTNSYSEMLVKANSAQNVSALTSLLEVVYGNNARVINTQQFANTFSSIQGQTEELFIIIGGISLLVAAIGIMNVMLMAVSERVHDIGIFKSIGFKSKDVLMVFLFQAVVIGLLGGALGLAGGIATSYTLSYAGSLGSHATSNNGGTPGIAGGNIQGSEHFAVYTSSGSARVGTPSGEVSPSSKFSTSASSASSSSVVNPVFTPSIILEAIGISVAISIIAGIYPAWRASQMEPIDALRIL